MALHAGPPQLRPARTAKPAGARRHTARQWLRAVVWALFGVLAFVLVIIGGLWWWAGTEGSLATTLRWAGKAQPLTAEGTTGALRSGGHLQTLTWLQEGLSVKANDVHLVWQPLGLLQGELTVSQLTVGLLTIDDQRPPFTAAPREAPTSLRLALPVAFDTVAIAKIDFQGPSTGIGPRAVFSATNMAGRYGFDGSRHTVVVSNLQIAAGTYKASATVLADAPMQVTARLDGTLQASLPSFEPTDTPTRVPLTALVTAQGTLTDLHVNAQMQATAPPAAEQTPAGSKKTGNAVKPAAPALDPQAHVTARVMPWAAQPVAQAEATFRDLDLAAFVSGAPQTLLTGTANVQPAAAPAETRHPTGQFWAFQLQVANALSGPWNQQRLPLEQMDTTGDWADGQVTLQSLKARLGGGNVVASGQWSPAALAPTGASSTGPAAAASGPVASHASTTAPQNWNLQATLQGINPAQLHTAMAPFPLNGEAAVRSLGSAIGFDVRLQGTNTAALPVKSSRPAAPSTASATKAPPQTSSALRLRDANVTGSWDPTTAGGTLTLTTLQVRTNDASLVGQGMVQPLERGGKGRLTFTAPGMNAQLQGELRATSGKGNLEVRAQNAAALLAWLRTLPGLPAPLQLAKAAGGGTLSASWAGGWRDPAVTASLDVPLLAIRLPQAPGNSVQKTAPEASAAGTLPALDTGKSDMGWLKLQAVQARLSGKLSQAQLSANGQLVMDQRRITLQLAADGGRSTTGTTLATSAWQGSVKQLVVTLADPALGGTIGQDGIASANSAWTLTTRNPVSAQWLPLTANGSVGGFESSAGLAALSAPAVARQSIGADAVAANAAKRTAPALIGWQPVRWRPSALASAGTVTGLPLAWAEVLAGPQLASLGVSGDLLFNGEWDALFTDILRLKARLARASGDIAMKANSAEGVSSQFSAGIRQAEMSVSNDGDVLKLALRWDSERAGNADGTLTTRLSRAALIAAAPASAAQPTAKPAETKAAAAATPTDAPGLGGWSWPTSAPITGQLRAQLPKVGVWSVLAPPGWRLRGSLGADIAISGTRGTPQLAGTLQADDMALRSVVDGFEFGSGKLRARLDGTRLLINEFTLYGAGGPNGGGLLTAQGEAGLVNGRPSVLMNAKLTRLRASIRTDRQLTLSGDIQARLQGTNADVTGALVVDQALFALPDESTPQLGNDVVVRKAPSTAGAPATAAAAPKTNITTTPSAAVAQRQKQQQQALEAPRQAAAPSRVVKLAVALDMGQDFRVRGKGIDTLLRGNLTVSGDAQGGPRLVGTVSTVGGQYRAYGQRLDVEQSLLRFTGALDNPTLDILALRADAIQVSQRVGVQINGTALLPRIRLYAQPDLPDAEKLAWLITGKPTASGGAEAALLQQAALALLGSKSGDTGGGLASSLGLDELSFKGNSSNTDGTTSAAAVTLGKRFSRNFYAAYERSVSGALGTLYIFYDLSKRFTVRAQAGQQSAVDLIYTVHYD